VSVGCGRGVRPAARRGRLPAGPRGDNAVPVEAKRRALRTLLSRRVREYRARTGASHRDTYAQLKGRAGRAVSRLEAWRRLGCGPGQQLVAGSSSRQGALADVDRR
jgi:hypothetical protein